MKLITSLIGCLAVVGCGEPTGPLVAGAAPAVASTEVTPMAKAKEYQPEYTLDIKVSDKDPKRYTVAWTAVVNTGGWTMTTDEAIAKDANGVRSAQVKVTLESPPPDAMVTQVITTLSGEFDAGDRKVDAAELSVRRHVKGTKHEPSGPYTVVKTVKPAK